MSYSSDDSLEKIFEIVRVNTSNVRNNLLSRLLSAVSSINLSFTLNIEVLSLDRKKVVIHLTWKIISNTGIQVFKQGMPKNQHIQRKYLNFENCCSGELS